MSNDKAMNKNKVFIKNGYTLVELSIVVLIIAILASIAMPVYQSSVIKARRLDATASLFELSVSLNQCYLRRSDFRLCFDQQQGMIKSQQGYYQLQFKSIDKDNYSLLALAVLQQALDSECGDFQIDANQTKLISGWGKVENCW